MYNLLSEILLLLYYYYYYFLVFIVVLGDGIVFSEYKLGYGIKSRGIVVLLPRVARDFSLFSKRPNRDPHRIPSCSVSYRGSFLGSKSTRGRDDNTPPVNAKIKNEYSHASTTNVPL